MPARTLLVMTKPPRPGRVKTRLVGELSPVDAARLQRAFLADLLAGVRAGAFEVVPVWALDRKERIPRWPPDGRRQATGDLGRRLAAAIASCRGQDCVAVTGSDHPELGAARVEEAFGRLAAGADVVFGPVRDGGFDLMALRPGTASAELFTAIPWSSNRTLAALADRCRALGHAVEELDEAEDVDTPDDLRRLAARLAVDPARCPATAAVLAELGWLPAAAPGELTCAS